MQCNIDAKGKAVRLIVGIIAAVIGIVLLALALTGVVVDNGARVTVVVGAALVLGGGFGIFEGAAGWCAIRAMGFRTKL